MELVCQHPNATLETHLEAVVQTDFKNFEVEKRHRTRFIDTISVALSRYFINSVQCLVFLICCTIQKSEPAMNIVNIAKTWLERIQSNCDHRKEVD